MTHSCWPWSYQSSADVWCPYEIMRSIRTPVPSAAPAPVPEPAPATMLRARISTLSCSGATAGKPDSRCFSTTSSFRITHVTPLSCPCGPAVRPAAFCYDTGQPARIQGVTRHLSRAPFVLSALSMTSKDFRTDDHMELSSPETPEVRRAVLLMITLNSFATPIMLSSTNVALPSIARDLQMDALMLSWVPMAFLMASAMFVLIFGKVADTVGRKKIFLIGTAAVIVTSSIAAMSINGPMLLGARYLQGISSAMLAATQVAIISSVFPAHERGRYLDMTVAAVYVGLTAGPLLGGLIIDTLGWRATFFMQVPLAVVVMAIGVLKVKTEWHGAIRQPFDVLGAFFWGLSIALFCLGVTRLPAWDSGVMLVSAVVVLMLFLRH